MLTYKKAGVDVGLADKLIEHIRKSAPAIGGFAGLFPLDIGGGGWNLVACTDGVGTKLKLAFDLDRHETVGIDLVAMCVNDLICCGAKPLFFLDYYATGKLDLKRSKRVLAGIMEGCRQGRSALLGGETAEMPGFYKPGEYDLAGFSVGIVHKSELVDGTKIFPGDVLLGLPSSGVHSNGFSLVRKVFKPHDLKRYGPKLLTPTRIYVEDVARLQSGFHAESQLILGMAHITGEGLPGNVPRFLPRNCRAVIYKDSWKRPSIFSLIQERGRVPEKEMWETFNMGIGLVIAVRPNAVPLAEKLLPDVRIIGEIKAGHPEVELA